MQITLIDTDEMPADLLVVNAARVSFGKHKKEFDSKDEGLITYLAEHNHVSPFFHPHFTAEIDYGAWENIEPILICRRKLLSGCAIYKLPVRVKITGSLYFWCAFVNEFGTRRDVEVLETLAPHTVKAFSLKMLVQRERGDREALLHHLRPSEDVYTFHIRAPIFVARQLVKHRIGVAWNEISGRYVELGHEVWTPDYWRQSAEDKKQGSSDLRACEVSAGNIDYEYDYEGVVSVARTWYERNQHICNEQRRSVLPLSTYTEWYMTADRSTWDRIFRLRLAKDTQKETRDLVKQIHDQLHKGI